MNIIINPINTINDKNLAFQATYKIPIPKAAEDGAKEVVSRAGAAAVAAAALIIPTVNKYNEPVKREIPAKPTLETLSKKIPEIELEGKLIFDPKHPMEKFDYERFKPLSKFDETVSPFPQCTIDLGEFKYYGKTYKNKAEIIPIGRKIMITYFGDEYSFRPDYRSYIIQYDYNNEPYSIQICETIASKSDDHPLLKKTYADKNGKASIKYEEGFLFGTDSHIDYIPSENNLTIEIYRRYHTGSSNPSEKKHEWDDPIINDATMIKYYYRKG